MEKIAIFLKILQVVSNEERKEQGLKTLGRGYFDAYRLNPYNPLCYLLIVIAIPILLILYGVIGFYKRIYNPFLWD